MFFLLFLFYFPVYSKHFNVWFIQPELNSTEKDSQTLSSKKYVFEDKMTEY